MSLDVGSGTTQRLSAVITARVPIVNTTTANLGHSFPHHRSEMANNTTFLCALVIDAVLPLIKPSFHCTFHRAISPRQILTNWRAQLIRVGVIHSVLIFHVLRP